MTEGKHGRDAKGRFVAGNKGGTGRKRLEYAAAFERVITPDMLDKLILRAYVDGMKGDQTARAWLVDRLIGKVPNILDVNIGVVLQIKELLAHFEAQGMSASDVFGEMLATFAEMAEVEDGNGS